MSVWNLFLSMDIFYWNGIGISVIGMSFLWQEFCSCSSIFSFMTDISFLTGTHFLWREICDNFTVTRNLILWHEYSSCDRNYFLWQVCTDYEEKCIMWQELTCFLHCGKYFLFDTENQFLLIKMTKCGGSNNTFLWVLRISCHLGCQDAQSRARYSRFF